VQDRLKAVAFDVDSASLIALRQAFPEWEIETIAGATTTSLRKDYNPPPANLLLVGAGDRVADTLSLCRGLRSQAGRAQTPLLVLVAPGQEGLARAAVRSGAHGCLVLPVHSKALVRMVARALTGERLGDSWRDDGGEA
jgi:DNA-binding NarL/FixJ family response regulator